MVAGINTAKRRRSKVLRNICARWQLYLFLALPLVYILVFAYYPMTGIQIAFKRFAPKLGIWGSQWIGLKHFETFFSSYYFERVLSNTLVLSFYTLLAGFPITVVFALALNTVAHPRYKKLVQTVSYIPYFISTVVVVSILMQVVNPLFGLVGNAYKLFGQTAPDLMSQPNAFPHLYVWSGIWQTLGWNSIIYLAALSNVDQQLHEAAQIDGASRLQRVVHVDFPAIVPTVVMMLILNVGSLMNIGFEKTYLMQNNLNLSASEVISTYSYKVAFSGVNSNFGLSTAIGLFNSVVNFVLIVLCNGLSKRLTESSLW